MVSGAVDGERVEVVGEDRPTGPDPLAVVAFEAAAAQAVAAFEVADAALGAGAVAREAFAGAARAGFVSAGDEYAFRTDLGELVAGHHRPERPVERDLFGAQSEVLELGGGLAQQRVLAGVADRAGRREYVAAGAAAGVGGDLGDLGDVAELVRL